MMIRSRYLPLLLLLLYNASGWPPQSAAKSRLFLPGGGKIHIGVPVSRMAGENEGPAPSSAADGTSSSTGSSASKISQVVAGVSLIRNVAKKVQQYNNSTQPSNNKNNKNNQTATASSSVVVAPFEFPVWMQDLLDDWQDGGNGKRRKRRKRRRKPKWIQRSPAFQGLTKWAFDMCDAAGDGRINCDELYAGILLVHLNMAKYVGVTACNPLNRTEVQDLFRMAVEADPPSIDSVMDRGETIGLEAFSDIVLLSCAKISSRIVVYYTLLVLLVPFLTRRIIGLWQQGIQQLDVGVHYVWGYYHHPAAQQAAAGVATTTTAMAAFSHHLWALAEWTVQHLLSVVVVTVIMPWIFVKLNQMAPRWLLPKGSFWDWRRR
uniref:EF-hand domain-containing protein n=1 Tax=Amphora coffeiformis TaxID=265554 RepID=A0A7S3PAZ1_9STRA|mmetsp:Transcript_10120/g.19461  ORF Transcript_10120/g.19461 Transcript_10120/m.19461 type:complete len:376 (+) Transcript_10120:101-1228(+)